VCLRQLDIKSIVAYSSVVHIGVAYSGLICCRVTGLKSRVYECLSHGLSSPLMFYGVYIFYNFLNTRSLILSKGVGFSLSLFAYLLFLILVCSLGVPPLLSFFSELMSNIRVLSYSQGYFLLTVSFLFTSGLYLFYFFCLFFSWEVYKIW